jgi:hypothetical protein
MAMFLELVALAVTATASSSLVAPDFAPTVAVIATEAIELRVGGLVQVHAAALAGEDSLIENGDLADESGFRLRRARLGVSARFGESVGVYLAANLLSSDNDVGSVSDATLSYFFADWLGFSAGLGKLPFSRAALDSSRELLSIERPLSVSRIVPSRRLGLTAEGRLFDERFAYLLGIQNATEGFAFGNRFGGFLYAARLIGSPWGLASTDDRDATFRLSIAAAALYEDGPSVRTIAFAADILATWYGASLQVEALCDRREPDSAPDVSPEIGARIDRCGGYAEAGYAFEVWVVPVRTVVRAELFDDDRSLEDSGDLILISGGFNVDVLRPYLRAQLHYQARLERHGDELKNDSLVIALQGTF